MGEHLKKMLFDRFGMGDIPDGYIYFPLSMGGLDLHNPFVDYYLLRDQVAENPHQFMDQYFETEEARYRSQKVQFEKRAENFVHNADPYPDLRDEPFMSYEEFSRYRERTDGKLASAFESLMEEPYEWDIEVKGSRLALNGRQVLTRDSYEKWIVELYAKEMIARFGGLNIVDKSLLPMGLMGMLRQSRFKWQG